MKIIRYSGRVYGTSYANPWTHPETGFTCDLKELNCNVLREQYMGRKKNE